MREYYKFGIHAAELEAELDAAEERAKEAVTA
jgi:hypothetical protein